MTEQFLLWTGPGFTRNIASADLLSISEVLFVSVVCRV